MKAASAVAVTADGKISKTILHKGYGASPISGQEVTINYSIKLSDGTEVDSSQSRGSAMRFAVGAGQVQRFLELIVLTMKKDEQAVCSVESGEAYGEKGCPPRIPANAALKVEVELVDFESRAKPIMDMTIEEKQKMAEEFKVKGNESFKAKLYKDAIESYKKGIEYVDSILEGDQPPKTTALWTALSLNMCVCLNEVGSWGESRKQSQKVVERFPENPKARYLRGIAEKNALMYDEAIEDFNFALKANPTDARIKYELEATREKKNQAEAKGKKAFKKMFETETLYAEKAPVVQPPPPYNPANPKVFLDLQVGKDLGLKRVVIELFAKLVPTAAENFRCLCTGEKSTGGQKLYYKGSKFHKLVKGLMIQGGDFEKGDGSGGVSIYGKTFADENVWITHDSAGLLGMANNGPNTNASQFFILLNGADWLNKKHIVFGRVVKGLDEVKALEKVEISEKDVPKENIVIADCGEFTGKID